MIGITAGISGSDISLNDGTIVPLGPYGQRRGIVAWSTLNLDINKELEVAKRHENSSQNKIGDFVDFNTLATRQSDFVFAPLRTANGSYFCPAHDGMSPTAIFDGLTRCNHFIPIGSETAPNPTRETAQFLLPTCWRCVCAHSSLSHSRIGASEWRRRRTCTAAACRTRSSPSETLENLTTSTWTSRTITKDKCSCQWCAARSGPYAVPSGCAGRATTRLRRNRCKSGAG